MKHEKLAEALNEISDRHIAQAAKPKRKGYYRLAATVAAVLAVVILVTSLSGPLTLKAHAITEADYDAHTSIPWKEGKVLSHQLKDFFAQTMGGILKGDLEVNEAYSPLNLYMALALAAELSEGDEQVMQLLGQENLTDLRQQAHTVWNTVYRDDNSKRLLANSVWLQKGQTFNREMLDTLASTYYASSYKADFGSEGTNRAIAAWIDSQTGGLLKDATSQIDHTEEILFCLYSTVFYKAKWTEAFQASNNTSQVFHSAQDITCTFMNQKTDGYYYWGADFGAVRLSLKDGSNMWLLLPDEGKTPRDILEGGEYLDMLIPDEETPWENSKYMKINLSLPKFDIQSTGKLKEDLMAIGITHIFDPGIPTFNGFITYGEPVYATDINQATRVTIDEEGVTAASYIELPGAASGMPPDDEIDFVLDRPFLFVITSSNMPLFAGVVQDPS